ncbi:MAG: DNA-binding protein [Terrisporobacter sp.]|uniref:hypothetical protein n=1 Tax=Terrisporobacter sp. TaxID=1965305 RepID=UPI002FC8BD8C
MNSKDRIELFLKHQNEDISFEDISKKMGIKPDTLRRTLNKNGYKSVKGKYLKQVGQDIDQMTFEDVNDKKKSTNSKEKGNSTKSKNDKLNNLKKDMEIIKKVTTKKTTPKKDKKINISQDDIDKICEVYDWYIQVKDIKALKPKKFSSKKDINMEDENVANAKSVNIRVDKDIWEEFERLCSNSSYNKKEIITQALKDFMKTYKNLL